MTTYQDQPLSRRQIREREAEAARAAEAAASGQQHPAGDPASASTSNAPVHPDAAPEPLTYVTQGRAPLPQYDAPVAQPSAPPASAPPASAPDGEAGFRYRDYSPEGRRAARAAWQAPAEPADLDYRTLNRPDAGIAPSAVGSAAPVTPEAPPAVPAAPEAHSEATMSRRELRAFREAQEREQHASQPPVVSTPDAAPSAQPVHAAQAPYGSQAPVQSAPVQSPPVQPAPVQSVPVQSAPPQQPPAQQPPASDATPAWLAPFTSQEGVAANAAPQAPAAPAPVPPPLVEPEEPKTDAVASLEALFRAQSGAVPIAPDTSSHVAPSAPVDEQPASEPAETVLPPWGGLTPGVPATGSAAPVASDASRSSATSQSQASQSQVPQHPAVQPPAVEAAPPPAAEPIASIPLPPDPSWAPPAVVSVPPASAPPAAAPPASPLAATSSQPPVTERPRNHWSRQAELDDESQPPTGSLARDVGVGPTTSNALVLPEIPTPDIMSTPLTSTGDVLVTGSISLPASLASTGALPAQLDESDLDNLLDPGDHQVTSTDSQPVRAVRAVSTHTSSREIIGTIKPKRSNRALTALIIAAAGMAVVVVSLLAVAIASGVLG